MTASTITLGALIPSIGRDSLADTLQAAIREDPDDILVVADLHEDRVRAIAADFGVRVIATPRNLGPAGAINLGVRQLTTTHICVIADDDVWTAGSFKRFRQVLGEGPGDAPWRLAIGDAILIRGHRARVRPASIGNLEDVPTVLYDHPIPVAPRRDLHFGACAIPRLALMHSPLPDLRVREDIAWWILAADLDLPLTYVTRPQAIIRRHPTASGSHDTSSSQTSFADRYLPPQTAVKRRFLMVTGAKGLAASGNWGGVRDTRRHAVRESGIRALLRDPVCLASNIVLQTLAGIVSLQRIFTLRRRKASARQSGSS